MKVVIVNTSEKSGGAATAAHRLFKALQKKGIEVFMLVRDKQTNNPQVISINSNKRTKTINKLRFLGERLLIFLANKFRKKNLFAVSIANTGYNISELPLIKDADIVHLHWINQGMLSIKDIQKLSSKKKVVWTLHDLWPATGICHYPNLCKKYQSECEECPLLSKSCWFDLAKQTFKIKKKAEFNRIRFVGCSKWISKEALKSPFVEKIESIPNPIDQSIFKPLNQEIVRKKYHLPQNKKLLLFAAAKLSDKRKGGCFLLEATKYLKEQLNDTLEILVMGKAPAAFIKRSKLKVHCLGYLSKPEQIAEVYNCADIFVTPSLEDNLPNTIMEAMACGIPCLGFETGGIPEMIDNGINGIIIKEKDSKHLAEGIIQLITMIDSDILSKRCIEKVSQYYSEDVVAKQYIEFYKQTLYAN